MTSLTRTSLVASAPAGTRRCVVISSQPRRWSRRSGDRVRAAPRWSRRDQPRARLVAGVIADGGGCGGCCTLAAEATTTRASGGHRVPGVAQRERRWCPVVADSPDVVTAKQLLDRLRVGGFQFQRIGPGEDGPLVGTRVSGDYLVLIHIEGFSRDCCAWRQRSSSLIVPGGALVERQVQGSALDVLHEVLSWEPRS